MVELTELLFPTGVADEQVFYLLERCLSALEGKKRYDLVRILFEARAMALGGYAIHLEECCTCGRAYSGEGRAVFASGTGGISCLKCAHESDASPGLGPASTKALEIMQAGAWSELRGIPLTDHIVGEVRSVLRLHMDYHLGRRLRTARYLE
jgi:DNA repair protein RecO (recombination protein O)